MLLAETSALPKFFDLFNDFVMAFSKELIRPDSFNRPQILLIFNILLARVFQEQKATHSTGAKSALLDKLYWILDGYFNQMTYRYALLTQFEGKNKPAVVMYSFEPVHASLDDLLLLEDIESMFHQMKISAAPGRALQLL